MLIPHIPYFNVEVHEIYSNFNTGADLGGASSVGTPECTKLFGKQITNVLKYIKIPNIKHFRAPYIFSRSRFC